MSITDARRTVSWGDALTIELFKYSGGLRAVSAAIVDVMGPIVGSRNTFAKLTQVADPGALNPTDRFRGWILLVALGLEPSEWGLLDEEAVPRGYDAARLRQLLPQMDSNHQPSD